ncbi:MAG TPA: RidA family protein [Syntrophorhabdaceae bacterium]|nr:RidA family protein [Syntrophorhabdaceae bacterium]
MKEVIATKAAPAAIGPYSQAVRAPGKEILFCSGQIAINPETGQMVAGPAEAQAQQVMKNLQAVIEAAGFNMNDVVKTTIFLTDMESFASVNRIYESYFTGTFPARSTVEVSALPKGASVEIEAIACR